MTGAPHGGAPLSREDFLAISRMVRESSGIVLSDVKRDLVNGRLRRRLRTLGIGSFSEYREILEGPDGTEERVHMVNAITTNLTNFFREPHHFEFLRNEILPKLADKRKRLRIWSAGCSTGEEPYTIAMTLRQVRRDLDEWDAKILATDIDTEVIRTGTRGRYALERTAQIPAELRQKHTFRTDDDVVEMAEELRSLIAFRQLNLLGTWPMQGSFDIIFCRNVVIYFDKATKQRLFDRFADILKPDGYLFIGHSESLHKISDRFTHVGRTIHRRVR